MDDNTVKSSETVEFVDDHAIDTWRVCSETVLARGAEDLRPTSSQHDGEEAHNTGQVVHLCSTFPLQPTMLRRITGQRRLLATSRQKRQGYVPPPKPLILPSKAPPDWNVPQHSTDLAKELLDPATHLHSVPTDWSSYEAATPLWYDLQALIGVTGRPLSIAEYMRLALTHPVNGYYTRRHTTKSQASTAKDDFDTDEWDEEPDDKSQSADNPFIGPKGDFVTAPELSSVFGEALAMWMYTQHQGGPCQILECGPGRGSLMADVLRVPLPDWEVQHVHLVEASPQLRQLQQEALEGHPVHWHDTVADFLRWQQQNDSYLPTYAICQEFVDALPVYAFEKTEDGWRERMVDLAIRDDLLDDGPKKELVDRPRLRVVLAPNVTPPLQTLLGADDTGNIPGTESAPVGSILEVNPEGILLAQDLARLIDKQGGAALIIDYGQEGSTDSIRSFAKHEQVHFLTRPGEVDVTADVDFAALRHAVTSLNLESTSAYGPVGQGHFLVSMGIQDRVIQAIEHDDTTEEQAEDLYKAMMRLCAPEEMGERFKVLSIARKTGDDAPPGF